MSDSESGGGYASETLESGTLAPQQAPGQAEETPLAKRRGPAPSPSPPASREQAQPPCKRCASELEDQQRDGMSSWAGAITSAFASRLQSYGGAPANPLRFFSACTGMFSEGMAAKAPLLVYCAMRQWVRGSFEVTRLEPEGALPHSVVSSSYLRAGVFGQIRIWQRVERGNGQ